MLIPTNPTFPPTRYLQCDDGEQLAYLHHSGQSPGIIFLPGFQSSMRSTKSQALFNFCQERSLEYATLDYYGHGESSSSDEKKGTIGRCMSDAMAVLDNVTTSPQQILVGSSMGAWLMILIAQERLERIGGLVGIASAPDFTSIISSHVDGNDDLSTQMQTKGYCDLPTGYDEKGYYTIQEEFLKEAETHFILSDDHVLIELDVPIRLIHGKRDRDISYECSKKLFRQVRSQDKELLLIEDGDHRLSKPEDLKIMLHALNDILGDKAILI